MTNKQKQNLLAYLGYYVGNIDGIWGTLSKTAMDAFKEDFKGLDTPNMPENAPEKALKHAVAYDLFKTEPVKDETGNFWDEIEYFDREEFKCKCGGKYCNGFPSEPDEHMVRIADEIRKRIGKPIPVNSGIRCKTHNANVGGVSNSQHLRSAADLGCPSGCTPSEMASIAEEIMGDTGGIGIYSWGIHIDTRSTKSRWNG